MKLSEIFWEFLKLGCYSFGGPTAHIGYFRERFVAQLNLIDDKKFSELTALTQFLPGPGSSQLGMAIGHELADKRKKLVGSLMAFIGFTLPSAILLIIAALSVRVGWVHADWLIGLKVLAIVIVLDALKGMVQTICTTKKLKCLALIASMVALVWHGVWGQLAIIAVTTVLAFTNWGASMTEVSTLKPAHRLTLPKYSLPYLIIFLLCFALLPLFATFSDNFKLIDSFYRTGALVFGGGHVVLPLLGEDAFIRASVNGDTFLAGYGLAQGVPGPMFTLASFLGTAIEGQAGGILGGVLATFSIFLPGWLLLMAIMPIWSIWRSHAKLQSALTLISAATVGLLGAAFISPVLISGLEMPSAGALAIALWTCKNYAKLPIFALVLIAIIGGQFI